MATSVVNQQQQQLLLRGDGFGTASRGVQKKHAEMSASRDRSKDWWRDEDRAEEHLSAIPETTMEYEGVDIYNMNHVHVMGG